MRILNFDLYLRSVNICKQLMHIHAGSYIARSEAQHEDFENFITLNIFIASAELAASLNISQTSSDVNRKTKELQDKISSL